MKVASYLLPAFAILILVVPSYAGAAAYSDCPNTQVGSLAGDPKTQALYSECTSNNGFTATEFHWSLQFEDPGSSAQVQIQAWVPAELIPNPATQTSVGSIPLSNVGLENMGAGYTGDCTEAVATTTTLGFVDGDYYCGWALTTSGAKILLRAVNNKGTINDFSIRQNAFSVSIPVPAWGTAHLALLILLFALLFSLCRVRGT
jgi:hypothetical protein